MSIVSSIKLETQGSRVTLSCKKRALPGDRLRARSSGARRGRIKEFSGKSRKRLLDLNASIDYKKALAVYSAKFITLTFGQQWPSGEEAKQYLELFIKRLLYFAPEHSNIWRLEDQKRGAPHFHLLCFNLPYLDKDDLARWWFEIIDPAYADWSSGLPQAPFTRIEAVRSPRRCGHYISKYIAKVEKVDGEEKPEQVDTDKQGLIRVPDDEGGYKYFPPYHEPGRVVDPVTGEVTWLDEADAAPPARFHEDGADRAPGFNNVPYSEKSGWRGRFWGVTNRKKLPWAELYEDVVSGDRMSFELFLEFKKQMALVYEPIGEYLDEQGATIYVFEGVELWRGVWDQLKRGML